MAQALSLSLSLSLLQIDEHRHRCLTSIPPLRPSCYSTFTSTWKPSYANRRQREHQNDHGHRGFRRDSTKQSSALPKILSRNTTPSLLPRDSTIVMFMFSLTMVSSNFRLFVARLFDYQICKLQLFFFKTYQSHFRQQRFETTFHNVLGEDEHGYCKTYGAGVPRSAVYGQSSSLSHASSSSILNEITRQVHEATQDIEQRLSIEIEQRLSNEIEQRLMGEMERMLNEKLMAHLEHMGAQMTLFESYGRTTH